MNDERLTEQLARQVMGWKVGPDRFVLGGRKWQPRWYFQPIEHLQDAFRLLEQAQPEGYTMGADENGGFWARVRIAGVVGEARESSQARALTFAIARAIGVEVDATQ